jgi:hypothetical protein
MAIDCWTIDEPVPAIGCFAERNEMTNHPAPPPEAAVSKGGKWIKKIGLPALLTGLEAEHSENDSEPIGTASLTLQHKTHTPKSACSAVHEIRVFITRQHKHKFNLFLVFLEVIL